MARNRMIKPEFWASETLMRVSRDARLTFIGIWNFCDDYGFCLSSTRSIIGDVYPYDESVSEADLSAWLSELIGVSLLIPVDYKNKKLFFVKGWGEHQTVQHKSKRAFVEPEDLQGVIEDSLKSHESLIEVYLESHAPKRKKKEESNKEKEQKEQAPSILSFDDFWTEYNYKKGKHAAEKAWKKVTEEDKQMILDTLRSYLRSTEKDNKKFRKLPASYINQKVWLDGEVEGFESERQQLRILNRG